MKKDFFTKNISLKIFSVIVAVILWFVVMNIQNPVTTKRISNIPVQIKNLDYITSKGLYIGNLDNNTISLNVRGPILDLQALSRQNIRAEVNLEDQELQRGKVRVPVKISGLGPGIEAEVVELILNIESLQTQQKPIHLIVQGEPADTYIYMNPVIEPNTVQVQGPESKMAMISRVIVNVNVEGKKGTVTTKVPVLFLDKDGNQILGLESSIDLANVEVPILKTKKVPLKYSLKGRLPEGYEVDKEDLEPKQVTIAGSEEALRDIQELQLGAIDISDWTENKTITATILTPPRIILVDKEKNAELKVTIKKTVEKIVVLPIVIKNLPEDLRLLSTPLDVPLMLKGTETEIQEAVKDLQGIVDLQNLPSGKHVVEVQIPNNEKIVVVEPPKVEITLEPTE